MCGLAGFLDFSGTLPKEALEARVRRMRDTLVHRGPDDAALWVDASSGIALGHRRLSILDLSPLGRQPMVSASGRYVVVFNGEIYNFLTLRRELEGRGCSFRGQSDTETILSAVEVWGFERALQRFNGMFAIALWDRQSRALYLARDRFGEKPLYYGIAGRTLVFGSELKALRMHPDCTPAIDRDSLTQFFQFGYVPAPRSIYEGLQKLPPATWLRVASLEDIRRAPATYWSMRDTVEGRIANPFVGSEDEAIRQLTQLLNDSVRLRMISDVPLGAFLSGGIDSSTVVALMQANSSSPIRTFTIGFLESSFNEADSAKAIAAYLGTDHTELYVTPDETRAVIPRLPALYDEPFADASAVPTFLVAQLARKHVTVALSGDGGDELFGGYVRYQWAERIWAGMRRVPAPVRIALARAVQSSQPSHWAPILHAWMRWMPAASHGGNVGDKLQKLAELVVAKDPEELYARLVSSWKDPSSLVIGGGATRTRIGAAFGESGLANFTERMMYADSITYLPDDILVKVDRASMGVSLEARVPMLDPDVAAFAWRLPQGMKVHRGVGKHVLRQTLGRHLPRALYERKKRGFGIPLGDWLRGPLRDWAEDLLDERRMRNDGYVHAPPIRAKWREHLMGSGNWEAQLWPALMFQSWLHAAAAAPSMGVGASSHDEDTAGGP
jgi:asparagine synthase (glutamine-hydrolysing)